MPSPKDPPPYVITSVDHALRLIRLLQTESPVRLADAARRLDVAPSTAHRLLAMLVYRDFAVQRPDKRYALGPVSGMSSPAVVDGSRVGRLREVAVPHMEKLAAVLGESVNLVVRRDVSAFFIASVESRQVLRVGAREGTTFPAHLASGGKALLARLDDDGVRELYAQHAGHGAEPDLDTLLQELALVRTSGFAINHESTERGVIAVGRAIDDGAEPIAAVTVSLPSVRFDAAAFDRIRRTLAAAVHAIETTLADE